MEVPPALGHFRNTFATTTLQVYSGMTLVKSVLESVTFVILADNFRIHYQNCKRPNIPLLKHNKLYELNWSMCQHYLENKNHSNTHF